VEPLEDRTLLAGHTLATALPIVFNAGNAAAASGYLASPRDADLYSLTLQQGDTVNAAVGTQEMGSALQSVVRVFSSNGTQIASNDALNGAGSQLTFQAPMAGRYYVGVSGFGDDSYNPNVAESGEGSSTGLYSLKLNKKVAPLLPDLVGASFHVGADTALWGEALTIHYAIENRGGAAAGPFEAEVRLSTDNRFDSEDSLLAKVSIAGLAAGGAFAGTVTITLPGTPGQPPPSFQEPQDVFLGLQIDPDNAVAESNKNNNSSQHRGMDWDTLSIVSAEMEREPNNTTTTATSIPVNSRTAGTLTVNDVDFYKISLTEPGRLTALVHASSFPTRLSLFDSLGRPLVQSDGQSPSNPDDVIDQHLNGVAGGTTYFLKVEGLAARTGVYSLTTEFVPTVSPFQPLPAQNAVNTIAIADFNGDGVLDLAVTDNTSTSETLSGEILIYLGVGDGTFQPAIRVTLNNYIPDIVAGDFNGDGIPELVGILPGSLGPVESNLIVLLGRGDGTFEQPKLSRFSGIPKTIVKGDFNGDGTLDLAFGVSNPLVDYQDFLSVLLGRGDGTFEPALEFPRNEADTLIPGDFNGDGITDLATLSQYGGNISVLLGRGDGTFENSATFQAPTNLIAAGDFNGDGKMDLAAINVGSHEVEVFLGRGDGSFQGAIASPVAGNPDSVITADFNNDGMVDIAAADSFGDNITVLSSKRDGGFQAPIQFALGSSPTAFATGDFNGDGRLDMVVATTAAAVIGGLNPVGPFGVSVLLGAGDGSFQNQAGQGVGTLPIAIVAGDFNDDGRTDIATVNQGNPENFSDFSQRGDLSVLLGEGDGIFENQLRFPLTTVAGEEQAPVALVTGDFN
jgi:hypothetical protein